MAGMPTVCLAVDRQTIERVRPSRAGLLSGRTRQRRRVNQTGPNINGAFWMKHLRWLEPMGQPGIRKLAVELETQVEAARGER